MSQPVLRLALLASIVALGLLLAGCDCNNGTTPPADGLSDGGLDGKPDLDPNAVRPGMLGRHSALAAHGGKLMASAYESKYGDLVLVSASVGGLSATTVEAVDGVPATTPPSPGDYRDGISDPGDDVGQDTDIVVNADGNPMISYRDLTNRSLKLARRLDGTWSVHTVQKPADDKEVVGRYTSLILVDGKPAIAYLVLNITDGPGRFKSELRWAAANTASPGAGADWAISAIDSGPMTCQNLCAGDEACAIQQDSSTKCEKTSTGCNPQCASTEACIGGACKTILPEVKYTDVPNATGLWPSAVVAGGSPVVLYHDRVQGRLKGASLQGGTWTTAVVQGTGSENVGAFTSAAVDSANTVHVVYQDAARYTLHYVQVDPATLQPKVSEVIDDGVRKDGLHPVGADSATLVDPTGKIRVVYQDTQNTDLLTAVRNGPGSWSPKTANDPDLGRLLKGGAKGYGFYSDLVLDGGKVYGSTFYYDQSANPKGGLELFEVP
ncbi:MAG: hypothetical protein ABI333_03860 [bacterium]